MTTTGTVCSPPDLLDTVGEAVGACLRAVLDDDRVAARAVLRDGARRRRLVAQAEDFVRHQLTEVMTARRAARDLVVVQDVGEVSRLVDELARLVLAGSGTARLGRSRREALLLLARFGEERLHQLADGGLVGGEQEYLRCGRCLFDAIDRLEGRTARLARPHPSATCAAALATAVLATSRHALRAA